MATETSICNSALIKIGAERISSLTENNKRAIVCNEQYPKIRDEVLRAHPWNFAIKRVELAQITDAPAFEYKYYYQLPEDCLRVLAINSDHAFKIEGKYIATDATSMKIKYIARIEDASQFDTIFCEALAARLAADIAYSVAQNTSLQSMLISMYSAQLALARSMDAQEGTADQVSADGWINSRY